MVELRKMEAQIMPDNPTHLAVLSEISTIVSKMDATILVKRMGGSEDQAVANALDRYRRQIEAALRKAERAERYTVS